MVCRSAWLIVKWMSGTGMQECFGKKGDLVIAFVLQTQRAEGERSGCAQGLWWRQGACEGEMKGKECERGTGATAALTLGMEDRADRGLWAGDGEPGTNSRLQPEKGTFIFIWCLSDGLQAGCGTESIAHAHQLWYVRFSPARQWCCQGSLPLIPTSAGLWDFAVAHSARPHSAEESFSSREAQFSPVCNTHGLHHGVMLLSYFMYDSYLCLDISSSFAHVNTSGLQWAVLNFMYHSESHNLCTQWTRTEHCRRFVVIK